MTAGLHDDALEEAFFAYLEARQAAVLAARRFGRPDWPSTIASAADRIAKWHDQREMTVSEETDLERLLEAIEKRVSEGTKWLFVSDECHVSGGGFDLFQTREAEALDAAAEPLRRLRRSWRRAQNLAAAERLAHRARS
jgi:hypothetical protein